MYKEFKRALPIVHIFTAALMLSSTNSFGDTGQEAKLKQRLAGDWQNGLNYDTKDTQAYEAFSLGLVGPVWRFNPDNTFVIYIPCGIEMPLKLKDKVASGTWKLIDEHTLQVHFTNKGDWDGRIDETYKVAITEDDDGFENLRLVSTLMNTGNFGRFDAAKADCRKPSQ